MQAKTLSEEEPNKQDTGGDTIHVNTHVLATETPRQTNNRLMPYREIHKTKKTKMHHASYNNHWTHAKVGDMPQNTSMKPPTVKLVSSIISNFRTNMHTDLYGKSGHARKYSHTTQMHTSTNQFQGMYGNAHTDTTKGAERNSWSMGTHTDAAK